MSDIKLEHLLIIGGLFLLWYIYSKLPKTVEVVFDKEEYVIFKVFQTGSVFYIKDYTFYRPRKIYFKSYVDLEAYIDRKRNGWGN